MMDVKGLPVNVDGRKQQSVKDEEEIIDVDAEGRPEVAELTKLQEVTSFVEATYRQVEHHHQSDQETADLLQLARIQVPHEREDLFVTGGSRDSTAAPLWSPRHASSHRSGSSEGSFGEAYPVHLSGSGSVEEEARLEEVEELLGLQPSLENTLRINRSLQRHLTCTLNELNNALKANHENKEKVRIQIEEIKAARQQEQFIKDSRSHYFLRMSSFAVPYFKDKSGMPAPKNEDGKFRVDNGYVDLYTTKCRSWMTSERQALVEQVHKEWTEQALASLKSQLKELQRKLKAASVGEV